MFCTKCGAKISEGATFCTSCGKPVGASAQAAQKKMSQRDVFVLIAILAVVFIIAITLTFNTSSPGAWIFCIILFAGLIFFLKWFAPAQKGLKK